MLNDDEDDLESFTTIWPFLLCLFGNGINIAADYRPWRLATEMLQRVRVGGGWLRFLKNRGATVNDSLTLGEYS